MTSLSKYLVRQTLGPLILFVLVLTLIVWLTQSLQMLDLVINRRQSAATFFMLTLYVLPSLLAIIIPFATFCATLYALHRLSTDSELMVMWSAGSSPWSLAGPILTIGLGAALATLVLNLYLMPAGYRAMKDKVYEIRGDIATAMIRDGAFTNPSPGLTVYNRATHRDGELHGLLVHDTTNSKRPTTYLAELGRFVRTPAGPRLIMVNGNIQQISENGELSLLYFDRYTLDLTQYGQQQGTILRELSERYLHELLWPDLSQQWDRKNINRLHAEGHNRLASPLYNLALVALALVAIMKAGFNRQGYAIRIGLALAAGLVIRLAGFGLQSLASQNPSLILYMYLFPVTVLAVCLFLLADQAQAAVKTAFDRLRARQAPAVTP